MDDLEYIVKDALMMCDQSDTPMFFSPTYSQVTNTKIQKLYIATTDDATPITHIPSFLFCKKTQKPCMPGTFPGAWKDPWPIKIKDKQALIGRCTCPCTLGGTIEFITSGQIPLDDETKKEIEEMQEEGQRELDDKGYGNSVGECGFVEGMIPIWGSGKDMINDIQTGDVGGAILNGAFLIWDVGSIAVGVFSAGTGTAAMQGAKGGLKTTIKGLGKKILGGAKSAGKWIKGLFKSSADDVAEVAVKKTLKETVKGGAKALKGALKSKIDDIAEKTLKTCVFACFPEGTKVHTENGLKNIEDIDIGDKVWSYNELICNCSFQEVLQIVANISDYTIKIFYCNEMIETTAIHPFYTKNGWKEAGNLEIGDCLQTKSGQLVEIKKLEYQYNIKKVYNFEIANWHTYFVGSLAILVHNDGKCISKYISGLVGNRPLRELTHNEIYNAFKKAGVDLSSHAVKRLKDIRTQALGFNTPNDIMKIFNKGTKVVTERAIEQSYNGLKVIISKETGKIITITP